MPESEDHYNKSQPQTEIRSVPENPCQHGDEQNGPIVDPPDFSVDTNNAERNQAVLTEIDLFDDQISQSYQAIGRLTNEVSSKIDFYRQALEISAHAFSSPYAAVYIRQASEVLEHRWSTQKSNPEFWKKLVDGFLTDALSENQAQLRYFTSKRKGNSLSIALMSSPIHDSTGANIGVIVMVVRCESESHAKVNLTVVESIASLISCCAEQIGKVSGQLAHATLEDHETQGKTLSKVAGYASRHELAFAITNNLRNRTGCDLVALGIIHNQKAKILSISGQSDVDKRSPDVAIICEAMEECYDLGGPIVYQQAGRNTDQRHNSGHRIHQQWYKNTGNSAVASLRLESETGKTTILSLKRKGNQPFTHEELEKIQELTEPYADAFVLIDRANRPLPIHAYDNLRQSMQELIRPQGWVKKSIIAVLTIFFLWFIFGSVTYRITVPGLVTPAKIRQVSCPQTGALKSVIATEGDRIKQDDILCVFDHEPLLLEKIQLQSQWELTQLQEETARTRGGKADARIARATLELLESKLAIVQKRIEQSFVRAPFDGMVVSGDLRQRVGEVLALGEPLFEIAGPEGWSLKLNVPARDSADLKPMLAGLFATNAKPQITHALQLTRIHPKAELLDNKNVYVVDAEVNMSADWVKTGMEGIAKIDVASRPVWWVTFHRIINVVRTKLWF